MGHTYRHYHSQIKSEPIIPIFEIEKGDFLQKQKLYVYPKRKKWVKTECKNKNGRAPNEKN